MAGSSPISGKGARTGGRLVVDGLVVLGADLVFCVPGESYLPVLDGFYDSTLLRLVAARHDGGAAFMAEAYGKLTGRPGICFVTRGPGATNAAIAVHQAQQDATPLILFVGQVPRGHRGTDAFQELDMEAFFAPMAKWSYEIPDAAAIPEAMARAFSLALAGRPGPVVLALPEDILVETAIIDDPVAYGSPPAYPDPTALDLVAARLSRARHPLVIMGGSTWGADGRRDLAAFATAWNLPVAAAFRRQDLFANDDPHYVGYLGLNAPPSLFRRLEEADLVLALGARLDEVVTRGYSLPPVPEKTLIQIDPAREALGRSLNPSLALCCGLDEVAQSLAALPPPVSSSPVAWGGWTAALRAEYEEDRSIDPPSPAGGKPSAVSLDIGQVMAQIEARLPDDAVFCFDAGNFTSWPQRYLTYTRPRRQVAPICGAMGGGVPSAVAASLLYPERDVIAFVGDGGMLMLGQEIATALQYGAAPVILVFNNGLFGTIRFHQERHFPGRPVGTDLANPDFAAWARSFGIHGERVERTADFLPALERAIESQGPAILDLVMDPDQITARQRLSALSAAGK